MTWDDSKNTNEALPDVPDTEKLTASEWNQHVQDGHFPSDELNFGIDNGDPVFTDPQNADQVVLRYDRSEGSWVLDSLNTESLVIGGTLYEEDANSPINESAASINYSVSGTYREVIIIPSARDWGGQGHDEIRINGDSGANYTTTNNDATSDGGLSQWEPGRSITWEYINIFADRSSGHRAVFSTGNELTGHSVNGRNGNTSGTIDSIEISDSGGTSRTFKGRVFGRVMDV